MFLYIWNLICFITIPVGEKSVGQVKSVLNNWFPVDIAKAEVLSYHILIGFLETKRK